MHTCKTTKAWQPAVAPWMLGRVAQVHALGNWPWRIEPRCCSEMPTGTSLFFFSFLKVCDSDMIHQILKLQQQWQLSSQEKLNAITSSVLKPWQGVAGRSLLACFWKFLYFEAFQARLLLLSQLLFAPAFLKKTLKSNLLFRSCVKTLFLSLNKQEGRARRTCTSTLPALRCITIRAVLEFKFSIEKTWNH